MEFIVIIVLLVIWLMCLPTNIQRSKENNKIYQEIKEQEVKEKESKYTPINPLLPEAPSIEDYPFLVSGYSTNTLSEATMKRQDSRFARARRGSTIVRDKVVTPAPVVHKKKIGSTGLEWFIESWVDTLTISPAEQLIISELNKYPIKWHREVSFKGFVSPKNGHYRYDFYLVDFNTIIEYDGQLSHNTEQAKIDDTIKTEFCIKNGINLIRYNRLHYYKLERKILELMKELKINMR